MTLVKVPPDGDPAGCARCHRGLSVAIGFGVAAAWSPPVAIAVGVVVAVAGLLLEVLIWTSEDDDRDSSA
jgi:hypothetical protein